MLKKFVIKRILCFISATAVMVMCSCAKSESTDSLFHGTVGAVYKTDEYNIAESYAENGATVIGYESDDDVFYALENGKVDVVIADEFEAGRRLLENDRYEIKNKCAATVSFCAYFAKNSELCSEFNEAISYLKENGVIEKITRAYIDGTKYNAPVPEAKNGTLVLVTDASNAPYPFEFEDSKGNITGIDSDIAKEICSYLGYGLEIKSVDFDELFISLDEGNADFIMSASTVTEERLKYYSASDEYFVMHYEAVGF